jgi:hypothetical protein
VGYVIKNCVRIAAGAWRAGGDFRDARAALMLAAARRKHSRSLAVVAVNLASFHSWLCSSGACVHSKNISWLPNDRRYSIISEEDLIENMQRVEEPVEEHLKLESKAQGCTDQPKERMSVAKKFLHSSTIEGRDVLDPRLILFQQQIRVVSK